MQAIWLTPADRAASGSESDRLRNLQREHVNRLTAMWLRPSSGRADVRALVWRQMQQLNQWLQAANRRPADAATQAHLRASLETLQSALQAQVVRAGG